ncbi:hypothetical protein LTR85_010578 [Meristemomyces frigidus]|nr:hypothetical protein LTR85_010578 [Meristemomyces frigidus]
MHYGVVIYDNSPIVTDYFGYLKVPLAPLLGGSGTVSVADWANASVVPASAFASGQGNLTAALVTYDELLAKYPYLVNEFNLPDPVPADLLLTWGESIEKYTLEATAFTYIQGFGNSLAQPAPTILKNFPAETVQSILTGGFLTPPDHANPEPYDAALPELGTNALISSNVTTIYRRRDCIEVSVSTATGCKLIQDLDEEEYSLFRHFNNSTTVGDAVLMNSGIPVNTSATNLNLAASYGVPAMPAIYGTGAVAGLSDLHTVYYGSSYALSDAHVKANILETTARLLKRLKHSSVDSATPEFVGFNAHNQ